MHRQLDTLYHIYRIKILKFTLCRHTVTQSYYANNIPVRFLSEVEKHTHTQHQHIPIRYTLIICLIIQKCNVRRHPIYTNTTKHVPVTATTLTPYSFQKLLSKLLHDFYRLLSSASICYYCQKITHS